jgi:hypothetical protein
VTDEERALLALIAHDLRLHTDEWPLAEQFARRLDAVDVIAAARSQQRAAEELEASTEDVRAIAVALGLGDHARPYSAHEVVRREILPAIRSWLRAGSGTP